MIFSKDNKILILGIETSTSSGGAAICGDGEILGVVKFNQKKTHSFRQLECVNFILNELELSIDLISAIAVSIGPGSFTGVRIGLSIAKGLSYSKNKPLIGVSCLESLALRIAEPNAVLSPIIDANRGEIFAQAFVLDIDTNIVIPYDNSETYLGNLTEWLSKIPENSILAGNGAKRYINEIKSFENKTFKFASPIKMFPSPEEISLIGYNKFIKNELDDPALLEPIYLRQATNIIPKKQ